MTEQIDPESAIREVLRAGGVTDWMEVVDRVQERFGIHVSAGDVERVAASAATSTRGSQPRTSVRMQAGSTKASAPAAPGPAAAQELDEPALALRFVEAMGSFEAARTAIDRLERTVRRLGDGA